MLPLFAMDSTYLGERMVANFGANLYSKSYFIYTFTLYSELAEPIPRSIPGTD